MYILILLYIYITSTYIVKKTHIYIYNKLFMSKCDFLGHIVVCKIKVMISNRYINRYLHIYC